MFSKEEQEALAKVLTRVDALGNLWARNYQVHPPDLDSRFVDKFDYFRSEVNFGNGAKPPKVWFARVHAILNVDLRISNERDKGQGVFIDLTSNVLRLRWVIKRKAIIISLTKSEVRYIRERLGEDGKPKLARAWVDDGYLYIAITFEREVQPIQPSEYRLVIDVNSWRNGIVWALIKNGAVISLGRERPDLGRVERLYGKVLSLEHRYGKLKRLGLHKSVEGRHLWRKIRRLKHRLYAILRDSAQWLAHKLAQKAVKYKAQVIIDDMIEEGRRELLEEKLDSGLVKLYLANLRRFVKLLTNQLEWYGVPYRFKRLPSTVCPVCGHELRQLPNRVMICEHCGFKSNRDLVPIQWAIKLTTVNSF